MVQGKDISAFIFDTLKTEILDLTILPGQEMSENLICERFNASRTPVHVALQRLSDTGLLELVPYKGVRATLLKFDDIRQMIYMRTILETQIMYDYMDLSDPFSLEDCEHILRKQKILVETPNFSPSAFYRLDSKFHRTWFERVGLLKIWEGIQDSEVNYTRFRMLDIVEMQMFQEIVSEHEQLLNLMKARDKSDINALITYHMFGGIRRMDKKLTHEFKSFFEDLEGFEVFLETVRNYKRP